MADQVVGGPYRLQFRVVFVADQIRAKYVVVAKRTTSGIIFLMGLRKFGALRLLAVFAFCPAAYGQQPTASVSFTLDFPGANPSHYELVVANDGQGSYTSNGKFDENSDAAGPAPIKFTVSENIRAQIFDLAKRSHYFTGKVDSGRKNIANTGAKTLAYKDAGHSSKATYNYSPLEPIEQLTSIFQNLSITMEFGRRLAYLHKYEKLALDDELKRMEELQRENSLGDVQAIAPELKEIANDPSVMNVSRARALRMLNSASK
jgi:hypothetical protein